MAGQREQHSEDPAEGRPDDSPDDDEDQPRPPSTEMDQPAEGGDVSGTDA